MLAGGFDERMIHYWLVSFFEVIIHIIYEDAIQIKLSLAEGHVIA